MRVAFFFRGKPINRKIITVILYVLIFNALKLLQSMSAVNVLTSLLLTLLTTDFRLSGWRYTPPPLTNQNHSHYEIPPLS